MDNYPPDLAPLENEATWWKEPFQTWWVRVGAHFPNVPRNVARQWIWKHWLYSEHSWLPSANAHFDLAHWNPQDMMNVQFWRNPNENAIKWGSEKLDQARTQPIRSFPLARIMSRRGAWPAPPIVWNRLSPLAHERFNDYPEGYVLVEGHRRMELALALAARGELRPNLPVWILTYP